MPVETMPMTPTDRVNAGPAAYMKPEEPDPTFGKAYKAGFVDEQAILSWTAETENKATQEIVEGYDQFREVPDDLIYLPLNTWSGVQSPVQMQNRVTDVRTALERDGDIQGFGGFLGQMSGFLANPEVWGTLGIAGWGMRGISLLSRVIKGATFGAVGDVLHETAMQDIQELRTKQESAINIGAATVLTGLISGAFGKSIAKPLTNFAYKEMAENVENFGMRNIGSAQVYDYNSEKILNQPWITSGMLSPMRPLVASKSGESLWWLNNLWEHSYTTGKTLDGRAQQIAMETEVEQQIAILMRTNNEAINGGYKAYVGAANRRDLLKGVVKNRGKRVEFDEDVHRAMVNDDKYVEAGKNRSPGEIAAIEETTKRLRSEIYDVTLKIAKEAEIIDPEDFATKFAKSYAPRRWNKKAVIRDQIAVKQSLKKAYIKERGIKGQTDALTAAEKRVKTLSDKLLALPKSASNSVVKKAQSKVDDAFAQLEEVKTKTAQDYEPRTGAEKQDVDDDVQNTFDRIAYGYDQDVFMGLGRMGAKGLGSPLTARKVPLEDNFLLDNGWLDSNMEAMTMSHINHMVKPAAMKMKTGDVEMDEVLTGISKNYDDLIKEAEAKAVAAEGKQQAKLTKEARRLGKEKTDVVGMHALMRDRWYGRRSVPTSRLGAQVNDFLRAMRNYNTALMMGMVLPTSIGDVARWNMATIFAPELKTAGPNLLQAFKTMNLNKVQMQKIGIAHEVATQLRTAKIIDGSDILGSHGTGVVMDAAVHGTSAFSKGLIKATLLSQWTDLGKLMSASYVQNDLIQKAMGYAKLSISSKQQLARMGFDEDMANAIRKEVQRGLSKGEAERGINRVNMSDMGYKGSATVIDYEQIADKNLSERLQKIIFRESERSLVTPRTGDMPRWLGDTEAGRTVGQFTTFLHAAVQQVGVPIGKRIRYDKDPKAAMAATQMMLGGLLAVYVRMGIQGRLDEMEDWTAMDYALNAADYSGVVPLQMYLFNGLNLLTKGGAARAADATTMTRTTNRPIASVAGPTAGSLSNLIGVAQIPFSDEGITESEARKIRRAMLWNNLMWAAPSATAFEKKLSGEE